MAKYDFFYLIDIQYLGMRYHGWQIQGKLKTIQLVLSKTLRFIGLSSCKVLPSGRTDALVSAFEGKLELFSKTALDTTWLMNEMNANLPADVALTAISPVDATFNVIQDVTEKEYSYYFYTGNQKYPLSASLLGYFKEQLDIKPMMQAASIFEGKHDFSFFCKDVKADNKKIRLLSHAKLTKNQELSASFFPPESYVFTVRGSGFGRHQIRLMMGALMMIGAGSITEEQLILALQGVDPDFNCVLAPGSGLMLKYVKY